MTEDTPRSSPDIPIARILKSLAEASQFQRRRDAKLRDAIGSVMLEIGAQALVFRVGLDGILLGAFDYSLMKARAEKDKYIQAISDLAESKARNGAIYEVIRDSDTGVQYLLIFLRFDYTTEWGKQIYPRLPEFFCFASGLRRKSDGMPAHTRRWLKIVEERQHTLQLNDQYRDVVESYCRAIQIAMLRRAEGEAIFPPSLSVKFWNQIDDHHASRMRIRPWDEDPPGQTRQTPTATLSFDLRRSTFIMEHAIDKKAHADWLESLVLVLKQVLHLHNGIFDKFTGDGVLAHFPVFEFEGEQLEGREDTAVLNCVTCAWDMIRAAEICAQHLTENLTLSNERFGAAVGGAFDNAQWSVDRAGNPIVVGRGVVQACRLSNGDPGTVQISNAMMARIRKAMPSAVVENVDFVSKEYKEGSGVKLFLMRSPPTGTGTAHKNIQSIVDTVFHRSRRTQRF